MRLSPLVANAAIRSKAVVLLLLIPCFMHLTLFVGVLSWSLFSCDLSSFAIILTRESWLLCFNCLSRVSCACKCSAALPHGAVSWSAVCGI